MVKSDNSPAKVVSRLFHNGDYFEKLSNYSLKYFLPVLERHIEKCQHLKCISYRKFGFNLTKHSFGSGGKE